MLEYIRHNVKGTVAYVLLTIICIPFVAFGIDALFTSEGSQTVATVNGQDISPNELAQEVYLYKRRLASQMGENFDPSKFEDKTLEGPVLEELVRRTLLGQAANDAGVIVGKQQIDQAIVSQEQFQQDGVFSPDKYQNVLRGAGLTPKMYRSAMTDQAQLQQLTSGFMSSSVVATAEVETALSLVNQKRDVNYLVLPISSAMTQTSVGDDEIKSYYQENVEMYQTEEMLSVNYIELNIEDIDVEVSEDELKEAYSAKVQESLTDARRRVAHILIENDKQENIATVSTRMQQGDSFEDLAKEYSQDIATANQGGDLGYALAGAFPPEFEEAMLTLTVGEVSQPVETDAGTHFIKLVEIETVESSSFEAERESILADLRRAKAEPLFAAKIEELADAAFSAIDLVDPADAMGLKLSNSGFFGRDGSTTGLFTNQKIVSVSYSDLVLLEKTNSDVIEIDSSHVIVIHVDEHKLPKAKPLTQVAARISAALTKEKASAAIRDTADTLLASNIDSANIAAKAEALDIEIVSLSGVTRTEFNDGDGAVVAGAFNAQPVSGEAVGSVNLNDGSIAIYVVNNVVNAENSDETDPQLFAIERMLMNSHAQQDIVAYEAGLKAVADIDIN